MVFRNVRCRKDVNAIEGFPVTFRSEPVRDSPCEAAESSASVLVDSTYEEANTLVLLEDTRNKIGKHKNIEAYCKRCGIQLVRQCLDVGDYMLPGGNVSVDTKRNLDEVATNLLNRTHRDSLRFWREARRAHESGIHLVVLVEHGTNIKSVRDVVDWQSEYSRIKGRSIANEMLRTERAYGVRWVFCDKRSTGRVLMEILHGEHPYRAECSI